MTLPVVAGDDIKHAETAGASTPTQTLTGGISLELPEFDTPPGDPLDLLARWLELAQKHAVREPRALALATANIDGRASSRIVLLKSLKGGIVFTSHYGSRKGRDLEGVPWAAGTLYWRETLQQINIAGPVFRLSDDEADALFAERPVAAQAAAVVSKQSERLVDEQQLRAEAKRILDAGGLPRRPPGWGGFRLLPDRLEFWHGSPDRLHRRLMYARSEQGWTHERLHP